MSTLKQKNLAENIVNNSKRKDPLNKQELVVSSGYSPTTADGHANQIIEQEGVKEALADLGFTEENAKKVVSEIMLNPEEDSNARLKATDQVFKVHGSYNEAGEGNRTLIINIIPESAQRYAISPSTETNSSGQA